jgi:hypothetical protein
MADLQVTWLHCRPRVATSEYELQREPHEYIAALGGPRWAFTAPEAIRALQGGRRLFVRVGDGRESVAIVDMGLDGPYLRAYAHGNWTNTLLSLPDRS